MIKPVIFALSLLLFTDTAHPETSPHDLSFREAAMIASRMPSPDGERFLFGKNSNTNHQTRISRFHFFRWRSK